MLINVLLAELLEVLGDHMAPGMEIDIAIRAHSLPYIWPREVVNRIEEFHPLFTGQHYPDRDRYSRITFSDNRWRRCSRFR